jgi:hypothetical protein
VPSRRPQLERAAAAAVPGGAFATRMGGMPTLPFFQTRLPDGPASMLSVAEKPANSVSVLAVTTGRIHGRQVAFPLQDPYPQPWFTAGVRLEGEAECRAWGAASPFPCSLTRTRHCFDGAPKVGCWWTPPLHL